MNRTAEGIAADHPQDPHNEQNKKNRKHENAPAAIRTQAGLLKLALTEVLSPNAAVILSRSCDGES
jgi:hypothetical protein